MSHGQRNGKGQLVLSRREDERILIGDDITIQVVYIGESMVKLGVNAPRHVAVDREEIRMRADYRERTNGEGESS